MPHKRSELATQCPYCGIRHKLITAASDPLALPEDGDVALCMQCGKFAIFDNTIIDGLIRPPTPQEKHIIENTAELQRLQFAWQLAQITFEGKS